MMSLAYPSHKNENIRDALASFESGMDQECELMVPKEPPKWLDKEKYLIGQKLYDNYSFAIMISNFRSLIIGLSVNNLR